MKQSPLAFASVAVVATLWLVGTCAPDSQGPHPHRATEESPEPLGLVTDSAEMLSASERLELEQLLGDFEARTGNEFPVLTVPSTGSEGIEEFSLRVARDWGIGKKGLDNGLLVVVARDDRRARIEVGSGLSQGSIPDSVAQEVMHRDLVPALREGRWSEGLHAVLQSLMAAAEEP